MPDRLDHFGPELLLDIPARGTRRRAVEEALREAIRRGRLAPGTRLPSTRDLAAQLGLSRGTVTQAYEQLEAEGWLQGRSGSGTRVADGVPRPRGDRAARARVVATRPEGDRAPAMLPRREPRHDLRPGHPDARAFPREAWGRAMRWAIRQAPVDAFGPGDPRGRAELRSTLAAYLGRVRGVRVDPAHVIICSGYTQGLGLLAEAFAGLGITAAGMENPGIGDHVAIVAGRLRVADIGVDAGGMSATELAESGARVAVCTPAHQFPLGMSMSPGRRSDMVSWAQDLAGWIVEDDYDGEFRYDRRPVGALQSRLPTRTVYVGSTSKSLGPAVRLGWIACPPCLLEPLAEAKRLARPTSSLEQLTMARLIDSGDYDRHLRAVRRSYRQRRDLLAATVHSRLPGARVLGIEAGLHAILQLPDGAPDEAAAMGALRAASIGVHPLSAYVRVAPGHAPETPSLVVGYGTPPAHAYQAAIGALTGVLRDLLVQRNAS
ncbi:MAG TPA: PLP-dependent aminotransferase family protein [Trebonia sp.]